MNLNLLLLLGLPPDRLPGFQPNVRLSPLECLDALRVLAPTATNTTFALAPRGFERVAGRR